MRKSFISLVVVAVVCPLVPVHGYAGPQEGTYTLIGDRVSTYNDGTPLPEAPTYKAVWSTDPAMLDNVAAATKYALPPTTDITAPSWDLDLAANGWQIMDKIYLAVAACINGGTLCGNWSPVYPWYVGHTDNTSPAGVIIRRINPASSPDTFIISVPPQASPAAGYKVYFSDNSVRRVFQGASLDFGNRSNICISASNKAIYAAVVAYDETGKETGFDKPVFWRRSTVDCPDVMNCRVDGTHSAFPFGLHIGKMAESLPDISWCDSNLPLPVLTPEQQAIQNADFDGNGRVGPEDAFLLGIDYSQSTQ